MPIKKIISDTSRKRELTVEIVNILTDPDIAFPTRGRLGELCGFNKPSTLYKYFTPQELSDLEKEGLDQRRKKYAPKISLIDAAILERAATGDPTAAKLAYQRLEGWSEKNDLNITGNLNITVIDRFGDSDGTKA